MALIKPDKSKVYDSDPLYGTPFYTLPSELRNPRPLAPSAHDILHGIGDAFNAFEDATQPGSPPRVPIPNSGKSASTANIPEIEFINADLAKHYGMSTATAYQEALENTSYQRAMKDMKAAGLNPAVMFGTGRAHGAGSNVFPSDEQSGGSGGYSRRSGGSAKNQMFSSSMYGALSAIGGLVGIVVTGRPDGFWIGSQVSQGAMHLMNAFNKK